MRVIRHIDSPSTVVKPGVQHPQSDDDYLTVAEAIILAVRGSATRADAAEYASVSPAAVTTWVNRGSAHINKMYAEGIEEPDPDEAPYVELALAVRQAEAAARVAVVAAIRKAVQREWRAGAWLMEHRGGPEWAAPTRTIGVQVEAPVGGGSLGAVVPDERIDELENVARQRQLAAAQAIDVQEATG